MSRELTRDINRLVFFRNLLNHPIFDNYLKLSESVENRTSPLTEKYYYTLRSDLIKFSLKRKVIAPTLWKNFLLHSLLEDPVTNDLIGADLTPYNAWLYEDFKTLLKLFDTEPAKKLEIEPLNLPYRDSPLARAFMEGDPKKVLEIFIEELKDKNLSALERHKIFKIGKEELLEPLATSYKPIDELIGYESQKKKLIENTRALINHNAGLNTLLYGDMGTGKSTMVKALTDSFKDEPLRFIEIKKSQIDRMPEIYKAVSQSNFPTILFIDDLSFDEGDDSFKELKNLLEGSFDEQPKNLLVYATSNRRNLISQSKSEREDAINARELLEEKLSLVSRFGLTINFRTPNQEDYLNIVEKLLEKKGVKLDQNLREQAIQWELRHTNRSGRTAEQFVKHVTG